MRRCSPFVLRLLAAVLLAGFSTGLVAQTATKEPEDWRARWKKQWYAKQARLAREKKQKTLSLEVPPPVEDTQSSASSPALTPEFSGTGTSVFTPPAPVGGSKSKAFLPVTKASSASKRKQDAGTVKETAAGKTDVPPTKSEATPLATVKQEAQIQTVPAPAVPANEGAAPVKENSALLEQTRPDIVPAPALGETANRTQDNPFAAVGDSWRMIAYLLPLLVVLIGGLHLLRRYQEKKGRLPGPVQAAAKSARGFGTAAPRPRRGLFQGLLGGLHLHNARQTGGSSIRTVESIPLGGVNLHLIEVRGRLLLLGATGSNVNLLAEWEEKPGLGGDEFRSLLQAAASDMDGLNLDGSDWPARAIVGTLEDEMRDTGQALTRRARRLRTVMEAEAESQQGSEYVG